MRSAFGAIILAASVACGTAAPPAGDGLLSPETLKAFAPLMDGWDRGQVTAQSITAPESATVVTTAYTQGEARLELEISDTGGAPSMVDSLAEMAGSDLNRPVGNGYFKGTTIAGAPAVESWNTVDRLGEITVLVKKRYIVHVGGRGLPDAAPMRALIEQIKIADLK